MARVLVVDDNRDILETTASLLELRGYQVEAVAQVHDVLPALRERTPDLLLQDCHMPGLDLAALIRSIRAESRLRSLPILLFTASVDAEDFWRPIGADGLIRKPFEADDLGRAIEAHLAVRLAHKG